MSILRELLDMETQNKTAAELAEEIGVDEKSVIYSIAGAKRYGIEIPYVKKMPKPAEKKKPKLESSFKVARAKVNNSGMPVWLASMSGYNWD